MNPDYDYLYDPECRAENRPDNEGIWIVVFERYYDGKKCAFRYEGDYEDAENETHPGDYWQLDEIYREPVRRTSHGLEV